MLRFLKLFTLGDGRLDPKLRTELEAEGLVLVEEGLRGTVAYSHFKAPGRRHHGKVTGERMAIGISERRLVVYCRSGAAELIDSPFSEPRLAAVEVALEGDETVAFRVDYDRMPAAGDVSGVITIRARSPKAALIVAELRRRMPLADG